MLYDVLAILLASRRRRDPPHVHEPDRGPVIVPSILSRGR